MAKSARGLACKAMEIQKPSAPLRVAAKLGIWGRAIFDSFAMGRIMQLNRAGFAPFG
jgi:hypothetical protein